MEIQTSSLTFTVKGGVFLFLLKKWRFYKMSIFIGGAWAYANGSLHLGHISSLLPGDILGEILSVKRRTGFICFRK